jgi:hypothetical protein
MMGSNQRIYYGMMGSNGYMEGSWCRWRHLVGHHREGGAVALALPILPVVLPACTRSGSREQKFLARQPHHQSRGGDLVDRIQRIYDG